MVIIVFFKHNTFVYFRYDRVFLAYPERTNQMTWEQYRIVCQTTKSSHLHLKYLCEKTLQQNNFIPLDAHEEEAETSKITVNIESRKKNALEEFLLILIRRTQDFVSFKVLQYCSNCWWEMHLFQQ